MDRRQFPRVAAPVFCRPLGKALFGSRRATDVSTGGLRLYTDESSSVGDRLELELFLPDQTEISCNVEVVWVETLPEGAPARYDMRVRFSEIAPGAQARLSSVLTQE